MVAAVEILPGWLVSLNRKFSLPAAVLPDTARQRNAPPGIVTGSADAGDETVAPPTPGASGRAAAQEMRLVAPLGAKQGVTTL